MEIKSCSDCIEVTQKVTLNSNGIFEIETDKGFIDADNNSSVPINGDFIIDEDSVRRLLVAQSGGAMYCPVVYRESVYNVQPLQKMKDAVLYSSDDELNSLYDAAKKEADSFYAKKVCANKLALESTLAKDNADRAKDEADRTVSIYTKAFESNNKREKKLRLIMIGATVANLAASCYWLCRIICQ